MMHDGFLVLVFGFVFDVPASRPPVSGRGMIALPRTVCSYGTLPTHVSYCHNRKEFSNYYFQSNVTVEVFKIQRSRSDFNCNM